MLDSCKVVAQEGQYICSKICDLTTVLTKATWRCCYFLLSIARRVDSTVESYLGLIHIFRIPICVAFAASFLDPFRNFSIFGMKTIGSDSSTSTGDAVQRVSFLYLLLPHFYFCHLTHLFLTKSAQCDISHNSTLMGHSTPHH